VVDGRLGQFSKKTTNIVVCKRNCGGDHTMNKKKGRAIQ
jgi:hypothetical protein